MIPFFHFCASIASYLFDFLSSISSFPAGIPDFLTPPPACSAPAFGFLCPTWIFSPEKVIFPLLLLFYWISAHLVPLALVTNSKGNEGKSVEILCCLKERYVVK